jgi:hypothetical protein
MKKISLAEFSAWRNTLDDQTYDRLVGMVLILTSTGLSVPDACDLAWRVLTPELDAIRARAATLPDAF